MEIIKEINRTLSDLQKLILEAFAQVKQEISSLPDNENIKRIGDKTNMFTIQFSELKKSSNWSPEWYDFKYQYSAIVYSLEKADSFLDQLKVIIKNGKFKTDKYGMVYINPKVIEYLKDILN